MSEPAPPKVTTVLVGAVLLNSRDEVVDAAVEFNLSHFVAPNAE